MEITEAEHRSIVKGQHQGDLTMMIDTASFRQWLVRADARKLGELIGVPMNAKLALLRALSLDPVLQLACAVLSFFAFRWWGLLVGPATLLFLIGYKAFASRGVQRIGPAAIIFFIALGIAVFAPQLSVPQRMFGVMVAGTVLTTRLLYVYTARLVFALAESNYVFFKMFFMQAPGALAPLIWTDPEYTRAA